MTTIRDEMEEAVSRLPFTDDIVTAAIAVFGIDPDLPAEWATVDRCLGWLRERGYVTYGPNEPGAWVQVKVAGVWLPHVNAPTLHAAMVAVCRAVGEETP